MTEKKTGSGQDMLIVTSRATYHNQEGELLATNQETMIFVALGGD